MTVSASSRYAAATITAVTDATGVTRQTIVPAAPADTTYQVSYYVWRAGDRMDALAFRWYGDERQWWLIADANPELFPAASSLFELAPGTIVRIPVAQP